AWKQARVVYRVDPTLLAELAGTDVKVLPPTDAFRFLPHDYFVVSFAESVDLYDAEDEETRRFEGVLVHGMPLPTRDIAGRIWFDVSAVGDELATQIRGWFFGTTLETGEAQIVSTSIPGPASDWGDVDSLEEFFDDEVWFAPERQWESGTHNY